MRSALAGLFTAALLATAAPALAAPTEYTLDPGHTQVRFSWNHFGFSVPEANFNDISGTVTADPDNPTDARVNVTIQVDSIDTHVPALNDHLLNKPEFFKAKEHPTITFKSTGVRNVAKDKRSFELVGDLTVNGITKQVVLDTTVNKVGNHPMYDGAPAAGFNATTTLKRSDFGMDAYVPAVSDELDVRITVEAVEADAFAKKQEG
ncbi:YceI family protein [Alloalcanivorax gelatiniphagus]|uniref:YceI family protein n=1 Tax=Alloalcanivorax gelatiniphagus TaxID=1194167 RepID=A0ABY2XMV4_9GAMM|nr:YceI family protein [Alloalcanivorax gelatiniphagus]TMW12777.1 YceI family protein [Alloalcanivorax gelatiniphagus]|tara:strand:+ start:6211 stop:6828 length:618 start_codon:yes stop_codon:yes gene_type:complete